MKTPIEKIIEEFELYNVNTEHTSHDKDLRIVELLAEEKQNILDAWIDGTNSVSCENENPQIDGWADNYYKETFKDND